MKNVFKQINFHASHALKTCSCFFVVLLFIAMPAKMVAQSSLKCASYAGVQNKKVFSFKFSTDSLLYVLADEPFHYAQKLLVMKIGDTVMLISSDKTEKYPVKYVQSIGNSFDTRVSVYEIQQPASTGFIFVDLYNKAIKIDLYKNATKVYWVHYCK